MYKLLNLNLVFVPSKQRQNWPSSQRNFSLRGKNSYLKCTSKKFATSVTNWAKHFIDVFRLKSASTGIFLTELKQIIPAKKEASDKNTRVFHHGGENGGKYNEI